MKKYLRLILEIVLGLLLAGALAFGYWSYSGKSHALKEASELAEGKDEASEEARFCGSAGKNFDFF